MPDRGISIPRLTGGGAIFVPPPLRTQELSGPICRIPFAFDRNGKLTKGNLTLLTSGSPMTSEVRSKPFDDLAYLVLSRTTAISN